MARLAGPVTAVELARYPEPLAPATAARRAGLTPVTPSDIAEAAAKLSAVHDVVLVEGAGGLLVRYDEEGSTLADAAALLHAGVLLVAPAGPGHAQRDGAHRGGDAGPQAELPRGDHRKLARRPRTSPSAATSSTCPWPRARRCSAPSPSRRAALSPARLPVGRGADWLAPQLGGTWDPAAFTQAYGAPEPPR